MVPESKVTAYEMADGKVTQVKIQDSHEGFVLPLHEPIPTSSLPIVEDAAKAFLSAKKVFSFDPQKGARKIPTATESLSLSATKVLQNVPSKSHPTEIRIRWPDAVLKRVPPSTAQSQNPAVRRVP